MATTTTDISLTLTATSEWDITGKFTVPVDSAEISGIKSRIQQLNTAIQTVKETEPTDSSDTILKYAYGLNQSSFYYPYDPDDEGDPEVITKSTIDSITAAQIKAVETTRIYDYRD